MKLQNYFLSFPYDLSDSPELNERGLTLTPSFSMEFNQTFTTKKLDKLKIFICHLLINTTAINVKRSESQDEHSSITRNIKSPSLRTGSMTLPPSGNQTEVDQRVNTHLVLL